MTNTNKQVLGMGNALVDIIIPLQQDQILSQFGLPKASMQLVDEEKAMQILNFFDPASITYASGGSAANTIHGLANLGVTTGFIGMVGKDEYGNLFRNDQKNHGIAPHLLTSDQNSGTAITLVSQDSERTFATYLGAAIGLKADLLDDDIWKNYGYFHIEGYLVQNYELIRKAMKIAKKHGLKISIDMASYNVVEENKAFLQEMLTDYVDIVFANEEEAKAFTGTSPEEALDVFSELCDYAVVKIGREGSLVKTKNEKYHIAPAGSVCKDTNGAGDGYAAGFLYGLVNDFDPEKCGKIGSLVAGQVIQVVGPKLPVDRWENIREQLSLL